MKLNFKMPPVSRLIVVIPAILCFTSFILATLALFSGHQGGFLEEYAIVRLNTSMIGRDMLTNGGKTNTGGKPGQNGNLFDVLQNSLKNASADVKELAAKLVNDVADNVADELGVADWYSLHVMNSCRGNFGRNATGGHLKLNVTKCTASSPASVLTKSLPLLSDRFNLTEALDHDLSIGPLNISLAQLGSSQDIQNNIETINDVLSALFSLYVIAICFCAVAIFTAIPAYYFPQEKWPKLLNLSIAGVATFMLFLCSALLTVACTAGTDMINKAGGPWGIVAIKGIKLLTISWAAALLMTTVVLFWAAELLVLCLTRRRDMRRQRAEEGKLPY